MHHLLSTAPGTLYLNGETSRISAGTSISVTDEQLNAVLSQNSFLTLVCSDPVEVKQIAQSEDNTETSVLSENLEQEETKPLLIAQEPEQENNQPISTIQTGGEAKIQDLKTLDEVPPMAPINVLSYSSLPADATASQALLYLQELANLPDQPTALIVATGALYPTNKKVAELVKKILKDRESFPATTNFTTSAANI